MKKNIGKIIEKHVKAKEGLSVAKFAKLIDKDRSTTYDIFTRQSIDTELLEKIGQVLEYDFFQELLHPETIQKIILKNSIVNKIYVELDISEKDIESLGIKDKIVQIIKKEE
ncbi:MAG: hypothetical protein FWC34_09385 [Bacteroidetes bacterium]|nr:hypothetical protein [Bacteroidota bacterium]MCL2303517.1 hypothetical protein [Lentimicrobiaceae bacterium]